MVEVNPERVMVYVDGYNLYYGIKECGENGCKWLDLSKMAHGILRGNQQLIGIKYFTARIAGPSTADSSPTAQLQENKRCRQVAYLEALATLPQLLIVEGQYIDEPLHCNGCGRTWHKASEKMTDVNIATHLLLDAFANVYDIALVITADSDQVPPIKAIKQHFPQKRVHVGFPPRRHSIALMSAAQKHFSLKASDLRKWQLPDRILTSQGHVIAKPDGW